MTKSLVSSVEDSASLNVVHAYAGWPGRTQCDASEALSPVSTIKREDVTCPKCLAMVPSEPKP